MAGKSVREIKLGRGSAIVAIVAGSLVLFTVWFGLGQVLRSSRRSTAEALVGTSQAEIESTPKPAPPVPVVSPTIAQPAPAPEQPSPLLTTSGKSSYYGKLRVGNLSEHPVRVALLLQKAQQPGDDRQVSYEPPAHWDFAPSEGATKGLVVSLPNRPVQLKPGDILVAFAQDGSRRYWGPFVVGETSMPRWNATPGEWLLSLDP